jgi:hypothetical protein
LNTAPPLVAATVVRPAILADVGARPVDSSLGVALKY